MRVAADVDNSIGGSDSFSGGNHSGPTRMHDKDEDYIEEVGMLRNDESDASPPSRTASLQSRHSDHRLRGIGTTPVSPDSNFSMDDSQHSRYQSDDVSTVGTGSGGTGNAKTESDTDTLAKKESKMVYIWRLIVLLILGVVAFIFSFKVYHHTREEELEDFRTQFYTYADNLVEEFYKQIEWKFMALDILSLTVMSAITARTDVIEDSRNAIPTSPATLFSLPNLLPYFELHGSNTRILSDALEVYYAPLVRSDSDTQGGDDGTTGSSSSRLPTRSEWEFYTALPSTQKRQLTSYENEVAYKKAQDTLYGYTSNTTNRTNYDYYNGDPSSLTYRSDIWTLETLDHDHDNAGNKNFTNVISAANLQEFYLPLWQLSPYNSDLINMDLLSPGSSSAVEIDTYQHVLMAGHAELSPILNHSAANGGSIVDDFYFIDNGQYRHGNVQEFIVGGGDFRYSKSVHTFKLIQPEKNAPKSLLVYPVFDSLNARQQQHQIDGSSSSSSPIVTGVVATKLYWSLYFADVLPPNAKGLMAVLENEDSNGVVSSHSYYVYAHTVTYLGTGDQHEDQYDDLVVEADIDLDVFTVVASGKPSEHLRSSPRRRSYTSTTWINRNTMINTTSMYRLKVYPTTDFKIEFTTRRPRHYAGAIWCLFLFTSAVFIIYDQLVEKRHYFVMDRAIRSTAVVSSLFPATVRERLLNDDARLLKSSSARPVTPKTPGSSTLSPTSVRSSLNADDDNVFTSPTKFKKNLVMSPKKLKKVTLSALPGTSLRAPQVLKRRRSDGSSPDNSVNGGHMRSNSEDGALEITTTILNKRDTIADRFPSTTVM